MECLQTVQDGEVGGCRSSDGLDHNRMHTRGHVTCIVEGGTTCECVRVG